MCKYRETEMRPTFSSSGEERSRAANVVTGVGVGQATEGFGSCGEESCFWPWSEGEL